MISYIKGTLEDVWEDAVIVETGGIGYHVYVPLSVMDRLPRTGTSIQLFTSLQVREDSMTIYGFLTREDRQMFLQLLGVSGIGPKAALGLLSAMRADDLRLAIVSGDVKAISRAPGIGPKTAQRMILDLKDKISLEDILPGGSNVGAFQAETAPAELAGSVREAIEALIALGYSASESQKAVRQVEGADAMSAEAILKASLRYLVF